MINFSLRKAKMNYMKIILSIVIVILNGYMTFGQPSDYVGYWPITNNANDLSSGNHAGSIYGATLTLDRFENQNEAYLFDGNDRIEIASDNEFNFENSNFSISIWFRSTYNSSASLISKQSPSPEYKGWNLWYSGGKISLVAGESPNFGILESSTSYNDNSWHNVIAIRTGNNVNNWRLYIDGQSVGVVVDNNLNDGNITTTSPMFIGRRGGGNSFQGDIDEITIYKRDLTNSERQSLFEIGNKTSTLWQSNNSTIFYNSGSVGIGTSNAFGYKLAIAGKIITEEVKVALKENWPDFVFKNNYNLRTLEEVEKHINKKGHLPEIPSEVEVITNGINLGEMDAKLLLKIEELTLYIIHMNKRINQLETENKELKEKVKSLEKG